MKGSDENLINPSQIYLFLQGFCCEGLFKGMVESLMPG